MTTPSCLSSKGLSLIAYDPLVIGNNIIANLTESISSYTHTISANGGFTSASFVINGSSNYIEDWLINGMGRHIQLYSPELRIIWEGFVNQAEARIGSMTYSLGPLTGIANRVMAWYTPVWYVDDVKYTGTTYPTILVEDADSQAKYGIWEKVLNIGEVTDDEAEYIRDLYLEENANPVGNPTLSIPSGSHPTINIQCRGYIDWLSNYVYEDLAVNQWVYMNDMIEAILGDDPNDIISLSYDNIDENTLIFPTHQEEGKTAKTLIDDIVMQGDASNNRWLFGIYADRKASYRAVEPTVEYVYHRDSNVLSVETIYKENVNPWDVTAGKWVSIPAATHGKIYDISFPRTDIRSFFGEEVTFTAPDQVVISGAKIRKLSQYMAQRGLGGI